MNGTIDKQWHLAETDSEIAITEFEYLLWRVFYSFLAWQEDCENCVGGNDINGYESSILHLIRMKDRPKTVYDLTRLLNRSDTHSINYTIRKLLKLGLIEKSKDKKAMAYQATQKGVEHTDAYRNIRRDILINMFEGAHNGTNHLEAATKALAFLKGVYDEAGRTAASYKSVSVTEDKKEPKKKK